MQVLVAAGMNLQFAILFVMSFSTKHAASWFGVIVRNRHLFGAPKVDS